MKAQRPITGMQGTLLAAWGSLAVVAALSRSAEILILGCCVLVPSSFITWLCCRRGRMAPRVWTSCVALAAALAGCGFVIWASSAPSGVQEGAALVIGLLAVLAMTSLAGGLAGRATGATRSRTLMAVAPGAVVVLVCIAVALELPLRMRFDSSRSDFDRLAAAITSVPSGADLEGLPISAGSYTITSIETLDLLTMETPIDDRPPPARVFFATGSGVLGFCTEGFLYVAPWDRDETEQLTGLSLGDGWRTWRRCVG